MCAGMPRCALLCMGVGGCERVGVRAGVGGCARVRAGVHGYACVWDEFSEFLPENSVPTSADFNTYSVRIFFIVG